MSEFKVIETQEQLDAIIGERLSRQKEKIENEFAEKYSDYDSLKEASTGYTSQIEQLSNSLKEAQDKLSEGGTTIAELEKKIANYETDSVKTRVAIENGIPYELAGRLTGTNEEEIRKDAERFAKFMGGQQYNPPSPKDGDPEPDGVMARFKELNPDLKF
ncbi:MAG: DUF4355 domain-containing protein [Lachnospiraceae bacterium]|nr:DUF4355 domain-containing protein [Lachnospiraceae bacterium]